MSATCSKTLTWTPVYGETGLEGSERTEVCHLESDHTGFHNGQGGVFGPLVPAEPPTAAPHPPLTPTAAESDTATPPERESAAQRQGEPQ